MKSKDPDFKIPVSKDEFRCFKCDYPAFKEAGRYNEFEPGLEAMVCPECYKTKHDVRFAVTAVTTDTATQAAAGPTS